MLTITSNPMTDATTAANGDRGAWVVDGITGSVVVVTVVPSATGTVVTGSVTIVVNGTVTPVPLWEAVPVLNMVSSPYWFDTVSRTS